MKRLQSTLGGPLYRPDLIIIGFFVNEYQDVLGSNDQFQASIGFDQPPQDRWYLALTLPHLRHYLQLYFREPLSELIRGKPRAHGYFLGNYSLLERDHPELYEDGHRLVTERLAQIKAVADHVGAQVIIAMIPAPVQSCIPDQLGYAPRRVDLHNSARFDLELPQRLTQEISRSLGLAYYDLRSALNAENGKCLYQPYNMHWTVEGQRAVASFMAGTLVADGFLKEQ